MVNRFKFGLISILLLALSACGGSSTVGSDSTASSDAAADSASVADTTAADVGVDANLTETQVTLCPFNGTWTLTSISCGGVDITSSWKQQVPISQLTISNIVTGCKVIVLNENPGVCKEIETHDDSTAGITACEPAGCTFNAQDAPCQVGQSRGTVGSFKTTLSSIDENTLLHTRSSSPICGNQGELKATFTRVP